MRVNIFLLVRNVIIGFMWSIPLAMFFGGREVNYAGESYVGIICVVTGILMSIKEPK